MQKKRKKPITLETLARLTQEGFVGVDRRFDGLEQRMDGVDGRIGRIEGSFKNLLEITDAMRTDLNYVRHSIKNLPLLERDVQDLVQRVHRLERRTGLVR
ncbi:MAG: hypothetical protein A3C11_02500 [Candidatus Sungbacteria bacterium RIFCSPHIGHO2_02_FULL_49_12]|uniref:t-SNARE coiled-coil homology domain-containing protein n=1 Tax=Candidatus Sungbacteria bacterium RIFCSPHIGHO2_02_FULL_49_12 TaxID=1802271 RepID=A0A1G2KQ45_9BACT|nr:MAG: hypothetical protein A3C11_02500 [Candidatus Sungbacteria bacterium RIFCSPHIGHO2_02_FULL_49_12]